MRIGIGKKEGEAGHLCFAVRVPFLVPVQLELHRETEKRSDRSPDYAVMIEGQRAGALWKRTPNNGGDPFLSGMVESPAFSGGKLEVAVFAAKEPERKGEMDMVWRPAREDQGQQGIGGGGGGASSGATVPPPDEDDDIPF